MSKMESKNLQTALARLDELNAIVARGEFMPAIDACKLEDELNALVFHLVPALRLHAHEQREAIRQLVGRGQHSSYCIGGSAGPCNCGWQSAVDYASQFLED